MAPHLIVEEIGALNFLAILALVVLGVLNAAHAHDLGLVALRHTGRAKLDAAAGKGAHHGDVVELQEQFEGCQCRLALAGAVEAAAVGGKDDAQRLIVITHRATRIGAASPPPGGTARAGCTRCSTRATRTTGATGATRTTGKLLSLGMGSLHGVLVHVETLARVHHLLDVVLQLTAGAQGEQLVHNGQRISGYDGRAQADHIVIIKIQVGLKLLPLVGLLQAVAVALPAIVLKGFLHGQGDLLGVLCHGGVENQGPAAGGLVAYPLQLGDNVLSAILIDQGGAGEGLATGQGDLLLCGAALGLEDDGVALGVDVLQQLAAAMGRNQLALIGSGGLADDDFCLPLAAGGVHQIGVCTCKVHVKFLLVQPFARS